MRSFPEDGNTPVSVHGYVNPGFDAVRQVFAENLTRRGELGGARCAYGHRKKVVDGCGGARNEKTGKSRFDFWVAVLTAVATWLSFAIAVATPPKSGPFCVDACVGYPYTGIAVYIPRDFLWLYPGLLPAPLFVMLVNGIHDRAAAEAKRFSRLAVAFALMAATLLTADYLIQLRVIQPAVMRSEFDGLAPLTQYNPHGLFIALEEAGYLLMAVAFAFAGAALPARHALLRAVRRVFMGGAVTVIVLFVGLSIAYGFGIEYRFEVAAISVDWTVLIVTAALLARSYRAGAKAVDDLP